MRHLLVFRVLKVLVPVVTSRRQQWLGRCKLHAHSFLIRYKLNSFRHQSVTVHQLITHFITVFSCILEVYYEHHHILNIF